MRLQKIDEEILLLLAGRSWTHEQTLLAALHKERLARGMEGRLSRLLRRHGYQWLGDRAQAPSAHQLARRLAELKENGFLWYRDGEGYGLSPKGWLLVEAFRYRHRAQTTPA